MLADYPIRTTLPATDLDRARRFYGEILGFTPEHDSAQGISYRTRTGSPFFVYPSQAAASGHHTQMGWQVLDIEAEVADLKARGVVFEAYNSGYARTVDSIATMGPVKAAWFKDSEDNLLGLVQYLDSSFSWA